MNAPTMRVPVHAHHRVVRVRMTGPRLGFARALAGGKKSEAPAAFRVPGPLLEVRSYP